MVSIARRETSTAEDLNEFSCTEILQPPFFLQISMFLRVMNPKIKNCLLVICMRHVCMYVCGLEIS